MAHTDVRAALTAGIANVNAWAATEYAKIEAGTDPSIEAITADIARLTLAASAFPESWFNVPIVIRTYHGKNLRATPALEQHENKGSWEQWRLEPTGKPDKSFFIRSVGHDNVGIGASDNKNDINATPNRAGWEEWTIHPNGAGVAFRAWTGQHLSINDGGRWYQSPNTSGWETFQLEHVATPAAVAQKAEAEAKLASAHAAHAAHRETLKAQLKAEVDRRIAEKTAVANRIEGELATLAA